MKIVLGTRGSKLALAQAQEVSKRLLAIDAELKVEIKIIKSSGDTWQGTKKASTQDKKKWTGLLENALLAKEVDFVVHCGKDLPVEISKKTRIFSILKRANPFDAFIGKKLNADRLSFSNVNKNSLIGTASFRRSTQIEKEIKDIKVVPHRGNVPTRIEKLDNSDTLSGIIVAAAGLERLKLENLNYEVLPKEIMLPAMNQGTLVVQFSAENMKLSNILSKLIDERTEICFLIERYIVNKLNATCSSAISVFAEYNKDIIDVSICAIGISSKISVSEKISVNEKNWTENIDDLIESLVAQNINSLLSETIYSSNIK